MEIKNTETIVFYGQDFSPLEDAYIGYPVNDKMKIMPIKDTDTGDVEPLCWKLLNAFLYDLKKSSDKLVVGHAEKEIGSEKDYKLYFPAKKEIEIEEGNNKAEAEEVDLSDEENDNASDKNENDSEFQSQSSSDMKKARFGNLVGTVRKIYTNKDNDTSVHILLRELSKDEKQDSPIWSSLNKIKNGIGSEREIIIKLEIFSRFDSFFDRNDSNNWSAEKLKHYFFADMLLNDKLELKFDSKHHVDFDFDSLFDFYMLWILLENFKKALLKGYYKTYRRFERNDNKIKGSIDIARHIKLNAGLDNGCIAYSYRENSVDNMVNHLILAAFDYLAEKYPYVVDNNVDNEMLAEINQLKYEIGYPKYDRRTLISANSTPVSHPFFSEYRELQESCLMIMRDEGVSPFGNEDEHLNGILYYVPDLWESYLEEPMKKALRKIQNESDRLSEYELKFHSQMPIRVLADNSVKADDELKKYPLTLPDYVFTYKRNNLDENEEIPFFILDAKYKAGWKNVLFSDFGFFSYLVEDYNKCIRDMSSIMATSTGVVFPVKAEEIENKDIRIAYRFSKYNSIGLFYTIPIVVPDCKEDTYYLWKQEMKKSFEKVYDAKDGVFCHIFEYECGQRIQLNKAISKLKKSNQSFFEEIKTNVYL